MSIANTYIEALDMVAFQMKSKINDANNSGDYQLAYELQQQYNKYVADQRNKNQLVQTNTSPSTSENMKPVIIIGVAVVGLGLTYWFLSKNKK